VELQHYEGEELSQEILEEYTDWISGQEQIVGRLLELAVEKRRLLLTGATRDQELQKLNEILQEENDILESLREIEKGWNSRALDKPELADRCASLRADYDELRLLNWENHCLLICAQQYLHFSLDLLCQDESGKTYKESSTKKGEVERVVSRPGKLDWQV